MFVRKKSAVCIFAIVAVAAVVSGAPREIVDKADMITAREDSFEIQEGEMADNRTLDEVLSDIENNQNYMMYALDQISATLININATLLHDDYDDDDDDDDVDDSDDDHHYHYDHHDDDHQDHHDD